MNKNILLITIVLLAVLSSCTRHSDDDISKLKASHAYYLKNSPFSKTKQLSKAERKELGIPPNPYLEGRWELTMNPKTGRPTPEKLIALRKQLHQVRTMPGTSNMPWTERGPNNVGGRCKAVLFDPNDATLKRVFAGGVSGGLWINDDITNANSAWHQTGLPHNLAVTSITVDPNNSQVFYVGTGESYTGGAVNGNGIWKSTDGGSTWSNVFGGQTGDAQFVSNASVTANTPTGYFPELHAVKSSFGNTTFTNVQGNLVLVDDGSSDPTLGCNTLTNATAINGNIAVIERGTCYFVDKVKNAQNAGAIAVLMINNVGGGPIIMGGTDATITIPAVMISKVDGQAILTGLASGTAINVTITNNNTDLSFGYFVPGITHINDIVARDNNGSTEIYATAGESSFSRSYPYTVMGSGYQGLYKSVDGGATWQQVTLPADPNGKPFTPNDLEISADNKIWLTTTSSLLYDGDNGAIMSSTDGNTFTIIQPLSNTGRIELAVSKTDPGKMYLLMVQISGSSRTPLIVKTTDAFVANISLPALPDGDSTPASDFTNGQSYYDLAIEVDPNNDETLYVGGIDWFKSTNGGSNWSQITTGYGWTGNYLHPDQHGIAFGDSNHILFANDGGVGYTSNGGTGVVPRINNLNVTQFYHMAVAPTTGFTGDNFIAGAQDNGSQLFENAPAGISSSVEAQGGDGAFCFFDQDGDRYRISNYVFNARIRLYNYNTSSWTTINSESSRKGSFICEETLDSHMDILYTNYTTYAQAGNTYAIRRYSNLTGSISKTTITDPMMNSAPSNMKVSPFTTSSSKLYVGLRNGRLLRIDNANTSHQFTEIGGDDFVGSISDIEFGQTENDILVTISNYGVNSIFYTNDGGATWMSKEGDLPDLPVNTILQNPLLPDEVIIGTDLGVWATPNFNDANPNWYHADNGMGDARVTDLELRDDHAVFAATYGRGIFSSQFDATPGSIQDDEVRHLDIYPNPAKDFLNLNLPENIQNAVISITDMSGREVLKQNINQATGQTKINIANLTSGNYIVHLQDGNRRYVSKLIVQ